MSLCLAKVKYFLNLIYLKLQRTRGGKRTLRKFEPFKDVSVQNKRNKLSSFIRPSEVKRPRNRPAGNTRIAHSLLPPPPHTHTSTRQPTPDQPSLYFLKNWRERGPCHLSNGCVMCKRHRKNAVFKRLQYTMVNKTIKICRTGPPEPARNTPHSLCNYLYNSHKSAPAAEAGCFQLARKIAFLLPSPSPPPTSTVLSRHFTEFRNSV